MILWIVLLEGDIESEVLVKEMEADYTGLLKNVSFRFDKEE